MLATDRPPHPSRPRPAAASRRPSGLFARLRKTPPVLACAFNGVSLSAAVAARDGRACRLSEAVSSSAAEPADAVRDVVDALRRKGIDVPRQSCLATPQVAPAFLDIGVDPARPRAANEMKELVRWDMEAELAASAAAWTVTDILILRGDLKNSQVADLLHEAVLDGLHGAGAVSRRAAELAVEQRLLSADALAAASRQMARLTGGDEETLCAWTAPDKKSGGGGNAAWFCTSISASAREEWRTAFTEAGQRLAWLYPLIGAASLERLSTAGGAVRELVLEVHPSQLAAVSLRNGRIADIRTASLRTAEAREAAAGLAAKAAGFRADQIAVLGPEEPVAAIQETLASWDTVAEEAKPLAGLAAIALGLTDAGAMPQIAGSDPPPPPWRNPDVVRIGVFCLVLLALVGVEVYMRWRISSAQTRLAQIERETEEQAQRDSVLQRQVNDVREKEAKRDAATAELDKVTSDLHVIRDMFAVREKMIPGLVGALQRSVNDDVFLDSVIETGMTAATFEVRGWGLTDTAIHLFTNRMTREIAPLQLQMSSGGEDMRRGRDRLDVDGYLFSVRVEPISAENPPLRPSTPAARPTAAPAPAAAAARPRARRR